MEQRSLLPSLFYRTGGSLGGHLSDLQRQVDRLFDDFTGRLPALRDKNGNGAYWPPLDMTETADAVDVTAELPGVDAKDVDITAVGTTLTIKGEKKTEKEKRRRRKTTTVPNAATVRSCAVWSCPSRSTPQRSTQASTKVS